MTTRREFITRAGKGVALSALAMSSPAVMASGLSDLSDPSNLSNPSDLSGLSGLSDPSDLSGLSGREEKKIRIGIIGAENSHTIGYGKLFNIEKRFDGVEVKYVWGETEEFARRASERGNIPHIVKEPEEMMGRIDALIVDHRHARYHLKAATPFIKAGIPAFIDKPFCYRVEEGKEFLAMAREYGTPVTSYSSIAHSTATFDMKSQLEEMEPVKNVVRFGPGDFDSEYGGIFFYGVHLLQPLMYMFGNDIEKVKVTRVGSKGTITLLYQSGLSAHLILNREEGEWTTLLETDEGVRELKSRVEAPEVERNYTDMVEMFRTGKEPRSHESILSCVAVLEAIEKSGRSEQWVAV